jgi:hypothetical protein
LASQKIGLICRELKHKILRESLEVSLYRTVKRPRFHSIQGRQIAIQHHLFAANQVNSFSIPTSTLGQAARLTSFQLHHQRDRSSSVNAAIFSSSVLDMFKKPSDGFALIVSGSFVLATKKHKKLKTGRTHFELFVPLCG